MDATMADIYLVSRHDRSKVIGRPYIYLAVDTATQLIAGLYVGLECDETLLFTVDFEHFFLLNCGFTRKSAEIKTHIFPPPVLPS